MAFSAGDRLGPCEILAPIGVGGMGAVYRAVDTTLNREVAIKVTPRDLVAIFQSIKAAGALQAELEIS